MTTRELVRESNQIEGITREPTEREIRAFSGFMRLDEITVADLEVFVLACEPGATLRDKPGMDVYVGDHHPLPGGHEILTSLEGLLENCSRFGHLQMAAYDAHIEYEHLHPFMDGNGRSGRVLWHWMMRKQGNSMGKKLGFLHTFYYQALSAAR